ncbi:uncharacterized protein [Dermacentor andersoni]|uniref:uncharacterized protein n=1 Tax=Dermacentor andersoni TaxID=34620 RepID=UPI003B3B2086
MPPRFTPTRWKSVRLHPTTAGRLVLCHASCVSALLLSIVREAACGPCRRTQWSLSSRADRHRHPSEAPVAARLGSTEPPRGSVVERSAQTNFPQWLVGKRPALQHKNCGLIVEKRKKVHSGGQAFSHVRDVRAPRFSSGARTTTADCIGVMFIASAPAARFRDRCPALSSLLLPLTCLSIH